MNARLPALLICAWLLLTAAQVCAGEPADVHDPRARVAAYALRIHDYVWEQEQHDGVLLMYYRNYFPRANGNRIQFVHSEPYVVYGKVRGVPYSLASYGNGREMGFEDYLALNAVERGELANIYKYSSYGQRISMRFGMNCATFLSDCLRQGFPQEDLPVMRGISTLMYELKWKRHFTFGKRGWKDYENLQTADFLECDTHAVLVMENDPDNSMLRVMEQTAPEYAIEHCTGLTDVTVTLYHRGKPTEVQAKRLCMECEACLQATTGTQYRWVSYDELAQEEYRAVFVNYP